VLCAGAVPAFAAQSPRPDAKALEAAQKLKGSRATASAVIREMLSEYRQTGPQTVLIMTATGYREAEIGPALAKEMRADAGTIASWAATARLQTTSAWQLIRSAGASGAETTKALLGAGVRATDLLLARQSAEARDVSAWAADLRNAGVGAREAGDALSLVTSANATLTAREMLRADYSVAEVALMLRESYDMRSDLVGKVLIEVGVDEREVSEVVSDPAEGQAEIQVTGISLSAAQAYAGSVVQAQIELSAAPSEPFAVEIVSANPSAVAAPGQIMAPAGSNTFTVELEALAPQINPGPTIMPIQIQARKVPYTTGPTVNLTVRPTLAISYTRFATSIYVDEAPIMGGSTRSLLVILSTEPVVGAEYQVSVSGPASAPATLVFPPGDDRSATLPVTFESVSQAQTVVLELAGEGSSASKTVTVSPPGDLVSFDVSPGAVVGGAAINVSLESVGAAPQGGLDVDVVSSHPAVVPSQTITFPQGQTTVSAILASAPTGAQTQVTLTAGTGSSARTRTVRVDPPSVTQLTVGQTSVQSGSTATGTIVLDGQVQGPFVVQLSSNKPEAVSVPATVTVPAGAYQATFSIQAGPSDALPNPSTSATLVVQGPGGETAQRSVTVTRGGRLSAVTLGTTPIEAGSTGAGSVTLDAPASAAGVDVFLAADASGWLTLPATVHVPGGQTSAPFAFEASDLAANGQAGVTASDGPFSANAQLNVWGTVALESVTVPLQPSTDVPGGGTVTVRMNFNRPLPAGPGVEVELSTSSASVPLPPTFVATSGSVQNRQVQVTAGPVSEDEQVTVTATLDGISHSATVMVRRPAYPSALQASDTELLAGETVDIEVSLDRPADATTEILLDAGGMPVQIPASVVVPAGQTTATFQATSTVQGMVSPQTAVITASTDAGSATLDLVLTSSGLHELRIETQVLTAGPQTVLDVTVFVVASKDAGPVTVSLSSDNPAVVPLPASVIVDPFSGSTTFQITTGTPSSSTPVTLTASAYGIEATTVLTVGAAD
jgi:hypothetical protein